MSERARPEPVMQAAAAFRPGPSDREFERETKRIAMAFAVQMVLADPTSGSKIFELAAAFEAYLTGTAKP